MRGRGRDKDEARVKASDKVNYATRHYDREKGKGSSAKTAML